MEETAGTLARLLETHQSPTSSPVCCLATATPIPTRPGRLVEGGCQGTVRGTVDDATQAYRRASNAAESILHYHVRFQPRVMPAIVLPEFGPAFDSLKSLVLIMLERPDECVCGDVLLLDIILQIGRVKVQVAVFVGGNELAELPQNWLASGS